LLNYKTLIIAAFLLMAYTVSSQPYYFKHYQVENGLSNNAVICSIQDKDGFMWFGTKDGLNRFDGYAFKVFRNIPGDTASLGNNFVHGLFEDDSGALWVGTERGLCSYDALTETFRLFEGTAGGPVHDICADSSGNLWFIASYTLCRYNKETKKTVRYNAAQYFDPTSVCVAPGGTLWASSSNGLLKKYDAAKDSFISYDMFLHSTPTASRWIEKVYAADNGSILIGTSNQGVKVFDVTNNTYKDILTYNKDKTELFVRNFIQASSHELWIATESGIFIYNLSNGGVINLQKNYNDPYSISDNAVYAFCKDKEGGIWAGTYFGGINYYTADYNLFSKYFPLSGENSISGNVVREIHEDNNGNIWIGTEDAGLNKYNTKTGVYTHFQPANNNSISYSNIHGLLVNGNELWIGTFEHGLDVLDIKTGKRIRHYAAGIGEHDLKSNFIYCITKMDTNEIVLGTTRGAYLFDQKNSNFGPLPGMPLYSWYTSLLKDSKGIVWAGTYGNGINFYNTVTKASGNLRYDAKNRGSVSSDRINSIYEDSRQQLWFATEDGLCLLNRQNNTFRTYTVKNGFPSDYILSILEDSQKKLWISTSKGLVCFNPQTEHVITYTRESGILSDQFNFNSACKDHNGRMYFGSVKGMISFHPDDFKNNEFIPPVYITSFQVFNKELTTATPKSPLSKAVNYTNYITLPYDQSTISISFAALSYTAPEMLEYAYMLEGLDKQWTYLKTNRKVYFTHLSPGTYTFKVKAANSSRLWNGQERTLTIRILPPWWKSPQAYFIYFILSIFIVYWFIMWYHNRVEEKNKKNLEQLKVTKEKEILQAKIEFFTNVAHEIKTPLTLIKGPLEKVKRKAVDIPEIKDSLVIMDRNTNRLIDLTNQLLDFRQTEIKGFRLNFVKVNITELLEETYKSFKSLAEQRNLQFVLELSTQQLIAAVDIDAFSKILSNLFSNAVKYAQSVVIIQLMPVAAEDKCFCIRFINDGYLIPYDMKDKIFEPFFRLKETAKQKGTGIGLALSLSLAQLHKGLIELKEPEQNKNVFVLTMPIQQDMESDLYKESNSTTANTIINKEE
jgi:ligand-binding sensor domain-containing protein/signal transduction histidine kinase